MKVSEGTLVKGINDLIYQWSELGIVINSRQHNTYRKSGKTNVVTWGDDGYVLNHNSFSSLQEYIDLIESEQYSALLTNGDIFQFSYSIKRGVIIKHRLCWYPCPIKIDRDELEEVGIVESVLNRMSSVNLDNLYSRGPIRFDYDSTSFSEEHPEVHLHIVNEDCRIPVKTPLCLRKFTDFIFYNFYSDIFDVEKINQSALTWDSSDKLTRTQKERLHFNTFSRLS